MGTRRRWLLPVDDTVDVLVSPRNRGLDTSVEPPAAPALGELLLPALASSFSGATRALLPRFMGETTTAR